MRTFCIINLETRNVLTARQGDLLQYASEAAAVRGAEYAQHLTNHAHCVWSRDEIRADPRFNFNTERRERAPWL